MSGQPSQKSLEVAVNRPQQIEQTPEPDVTIRTKDSRFITELYWTTDTESCGAYFTRKMKLLGAEDPVPVINEKQISERDKASTSDTKSVTPVVNFFELNEPPAESL